MKAIGYNDDGQWVKVAATVAQPRRGLGDARTVAVTADKGVGMLRGRKGLLRHHKGASHNEQRKDQAQARRA